MGKRENVKRERETLGHHGRGHSSTDSIREQLYQPLSSWTRPGARTEERMDVIDVFMIGALRWRMQPCCLTPAAVCAGFDIWIGGWSLNRADSTHSRLVQVKEYVCAVLLSAAARALAHSGS